MSVSRKIVVSCAVVGGVLACAGAASAVPYEWRRIDGERNNQWPGRAFWGGAETPLMRTSAPAFPDGWSPSGADRPSPRLISNMIVSQSADIPSARGLSDMVWQWGQFIDHDISLTPPASDGAFFPIPVPAGDIWFDPDNTGQAFIPLTRSIFADGTGTDPSNPRQQVNMITTWIDGSAVYGSDEERAHWLRDPDGGGRLKVTPHVTGELLPFNDGTQENDMSPSTDLFVAGDPRSNEQAGLAAMHTLWVREHNRLADLFAATNQSYSDEAIYQRARRVVGAKLQVITYNEWLPALLGPDPLPPYSGYDVHTNPAIANEFSTALFRFGHTMLSEALLRLDNQGDPVPDGHLLLSDAFFNAEHIINGGGIDPILKGLATQPMQEIDEFVVDSVRNFLFGAPGFGGFDLPALNVQRGRDHGLGDFNEIRAGYGLPAITSFDDITSRADVAQKFRDCYGQTNGVDNVHLIDPWVAALAEDHVPGSSTGETIRAALIDQFGRLRDGDRFWYQNDAVLPAVLAEIGLTMADLEATTLAQIIHLNTGLDSIQANAFLAPTSCEGDADGDGAVDVNDITAIVRALGQTGGLEDTDGNGTVDVNDLTFTVGRLGEPCQPGN